MLYLYYGLTYITILEIKIKWNQVNENTYEHFLLNKSVCNDRVLSFIPFDTTRENNYTMAKIKLLSELVEGTYFFNAMQCFWKFNALGI